MLVHYKATLRVVCLYRMKQIMWVILFYFFFLQLKVWYNLNLNTVSSSVDNPAENWNHANDEPNYSSRIIKEQVKK